MSSIDYLQDWQAFPPLFSKFSILSTLEIEVYYPVKLIVLVWYCKVSNIMLLFDEYIICIVPFQIVLLFC